MTNKNEKDFELMKKLVIKYRILEICDKEVIVDKNSGEVLQNKELMSRVKFAYLWLKIVGTKWVLDEPIHGYYYAYEDDNAKEWYYYISKLISQSILEKGFIDTIEILIKSKEQFEEHRALENILIELFSSLKNINIISNFFTLENPSLKKSENSPQILFDYTDAMLKIKNRERSIMKQNLELSEEHQKLKR